MSRRFVSLLLLAAFAASGHAIVIRHDKDDALYRKLAEGVDQVCVIAGDGHGTLVAPTWVVTAAHVVRDIGPFARFVTFGTKIYSIKGIYMHPTYVPGPSVLPRTDIALIELAEPVSGVSPASFYEKQDEVGKKILFVGSGMTGNGNTGPERDDGVWRGAENTIDGVRPNAILFTFDAPPKGDALEGISGPGDSGGPALLREDGKLYVLGVSSSNSGPRNAGHCTYGTQEAYGRVSTSLPWLKSVMASPSGALGGLETEAPVWAGWPTDGLGPVAKAYFAAFAKGDAAGLDAAIAPFRSEAFLTNTPVEERVKRAQSLLSEFGGLEPRVYAIDPMGQLSVLAWATKTRQFVSVTFLPRSGSKNLFDGYVTRRMPPGFRPLEG